jgi:hypothetical protein
MVILNISLGMTLKFLKKKIFFLLKISVLKVEFEIALRVERRETQQK